MKKYLILAIILIAFLFNTIAFCLSCPKRIISLGPFITEELYLLNVQDRLIANTIYCTRPAYAKKKEKIGTVINVNLERIISLSPDLVLATSLTPTNQVERLKKLGIEVVVFKSPKNFYELCEEFLELGRLVGKEKRAEKIVNKAKKRVEKISVKNKSPKRPKVIVQVGSNPLWVAHGNSLINDFIEFAGGINIAKDAKTGLYSLEKVLQKDPDVIIITTMGMVGEEEKKNWEKYNTMKAVKNKRIYIVDAYKLCSPTPVSFVNTLKEMITILNPQK